MSNEPLPFSAAAERNRGPILAALERLLPAEARVLEIASGTGQHAAHAAAAQPGWRWQPTDADATQLAAIDVRCHGVVNVARALHLDVLKTPWPVPAADRGDAFTAVFCANMIHIAPWPCCAALTAGAATCLASEGLLVLYGPFIVDGEPLAAGNAAFDVSLRARDPAWGLRTLAAVVDEAERAGLRFEQRIGMPANNLLLVFRRSG